MTQWVLIVVMSSFSMTAGLHTTRLPAAITATFADRAACEAAGKEASALAIKARLDRPDVVFACVPNSSEAPK
jgi:hypothetical protein